MGARGLCILWLVIPAVFVGCDKKRPPAYGREFNGRRAELGIPSIPDRWVLYRPPDRQIDWVDPDFHQHGHAGRPIHAAKMVMLTAGGEPDYECDIYYSGKRYPSVIEGETDDELMQVTFSYSKLRAGEMPWRCDVIGGPDAGTHPLPAAEAILNRWGLSRLK